MHNAAIIVGGGVAIQYFSMVLTTGPQIVYSIRISPEGATDLSLGYKKGCEFFLLILQTSFWR